MKTLISILTVLLIFSFSSKTFARRLDDSKPEKEKNGNLFVMKAEKKFLGATVQIVSASGMVITTQNLERRKVVIDFAAVKFGTYTIRVSKGNETREFHYVRK